MCGREVRSHCECRRVADTRARKNKLQCDRAVHPMQRCRMLCHGTSVCVCVCGSCCCMLLMCINVCMFMQNVQTGSPPSDQMTFSLDIERHVHHMCAVFQGLSSRYTREQGTRALGSPPHHHRSPKLSINHAIDSNSAVHSPSNLCAESHAKGCFPLRRTGAGAALANLCVLTSQKNTGDATGENTHLSACLDAHHSLRLKAVRGNPTESSPCT